MDVDTLRSFLLGDGAAILAVARDGWGLVVGGAAAIVVGCLRVSQHEDLLRRPWMGLGTFALACIHAALLATALWGMSRWAGGDVSWLFYFQPLLAILALITIAHLVEVVPWSLLGEQTGGRFGSAAAILAILAQLKLAARACTVLTGGDTDKPATALVCGILAIEIVALGAFWVGRSDLAARTSRFLFGPRADGCGFCCLQCFLLIGLGVGLFVGGLSGLRDLAHAPWLVDGWSFGEPPSPGVLVGALGLALLALAVALHSRPRVLRMRRFEYLLATGDTRAALAELSAHEPGDYPAHWTPSIEDLDALLVFLEEVVAGRVAPWAEAAILDGTPRFVREMAFSAEEWEEEQAPVLGPQTERLFVLLGRAAALGHEIQPILDEFQNLSRLFCARVTRQALEETLQAQAGGLGVELLTGKEMLQATDGKDLPDEGSYLGLRGTEGEGRLRLLVWLDHWSDDDEERDEPSELERTIQTIMDRALATDCVELWIVSPRQLSIQILERQADAWVAPAAGDPHVSRTIPGLTLDHQAIWNQVQAAIDRRFPLPGRHDAGEG